MYAIRSYYAIGGQFIGTLGIAYALGVTHLLIKPGQVIQGRHIVGFIFQQLAIFFDGLRLLAGNLECLGQQDVSIWPGSYNFV